MVYIEPEALSATAEEQFLDWWGAAAPWQGKECFGRGQDLEVSACIFCASSFFGKDRGAIDGLVACCSSARSGVALACVYPY